MGEAGVGDSTPWMIGDEAGNLHRVATSLLLSGRRNLEEGGKGLGHGLGGAKMSERTIKEARAVAWGATTLFPRRWPPPPELGNREERVEQINT